MTRYDWRGAAAALALTNDLGATDTSFLVTGDTSGWPSGASGRPFTLVIDRNTPKEEKIVCSSLTTGTVVVALRGDDGTSGKTHGQGAVVEHYGPPANKMDDLDGHVYDTTRDDHTQYMAVNGQRAFTGVNAITGTPVSIGGDTNLSGSALTLARSDHAHAIEVGGISDSVMFAAQVVNTPAIAAGAILENQLSPSWYHRQRFSATTGIGGELTFAHGAGWVPTFVWTLSFDHPLTNPFPFGWSVFQYDDGSGNITFRVGSSSGGFLNTIACQGWCVVVK